MLAKFQMVSLFFIVLQALVSPFQRCKAEQVQLDFIRSCPQPICPCGTNLWTRPDPAYSNCSEMTVDYTIVNYGDNSLPASSTRDTTYLVAVNGGGEYYLAQTFHDWWGMTCTARPVNFTTTFPDVPEGLYFLRVYCDIDEVHNGPVIGDSAPIMVYRNDLYVSSGSMNTGTTIERGDGTIGVTANFHYDGESTATSLRAKIYLSNSEEPPLSGYYLWPTKELPDLPVGSSVEQTFSATVRSEIPTGSYGVWVKCYSIDGLCEADEDNNYYRLPGTVSVIDPPPPNAPSNLTHLDVTTNTITWSWTDNSDNEDGFRGYGEPVPWNVNANITSYMEENLTPNTHYSRHVEAYNAHGWSGPSNEHSVYTLARNPGIVTDVTGQTFSFSNVTRTSIQANWTSSGNPPATEYFCENITKGTNSGWSNSEYWIETALERDTEYCYRVKARNGDGVETGWTALGCETTLANKIYVDDDAPFDGGPGDPSVSDPDENGSIEHPFDAIEEAIADANDGDVIVILTGTYRGDGNRDINLFGKAITIRSIDPNDPELVAATIIDIEGEPFPPSSSYRGFLFDGTEDSNTIIAGFTIINGCATFDGGLGGGAINCNDASPVIRDCVISNNTALCGGGISQCAGSIINCQISNNTSMGPGGGLFQCEGLIKDCIISNNTALSDSGGGLASSQGGTLEVTNCIFENNISGNEQWEFGGNLCRGGAIFFAPPPLPPPVGASELIITGSTFNFNSAWHQGGGVYADTSTSVLTIEGSGFEGNIALGTGNDYHLAPGLYPGLGGGIYCAGFDTYILDTYFYFNSAEHQGGGIYVEVPLLITEGCNFFGNSAFGDVTHPGIGGGICGIASDTFIFSSLLSGNYANDEAGAMFIDGHLDMTNCTVCSNFSSSGECGGVLAVDGLALNSVLWANTGVNGATEEAQISGGIGVILFSNVQGWTGNYEGESSNGLDPMFVRNPDDGGDGWGDNPNTPSIDEGSNDDFGDLQLKPGSPCIDSGNNSFAAPLEHFDADVLGNSRFINGTCREVTIIDRGAYEYASGYFYFGDLDEQCDINFHDFAILASSWLTDNPLIDIEPFPEGDGIIDIQELLLLVENWMK